eukprot:gb/GFBE01036235.1/.p1 GENE.gb/GFBE01036235.1/~~gb/GFBE01036235.1/.p1  ORF type:complete len:687 (+),score=82.39 gb/GFBE01036235.1/:1-2061(+)
MARWRRLEMRHMSAMPSFLVLCTAFALVGRASGDAYLSSNWLAGDVSDKSPSADRHTYYVHDQERISKSGASSVETPLDASPMSNINGQEACMELCDQDTKCECAVFFMTARQCQRWAGCRINPSGFMNDPSANTLMKIPTLRPQYKEHEHFNTYAASGSVDIDRGGTPALVKSYQDCMDRCTVDDTCDCAVYATDGTYRCWKRRGCTGPTLVYDPIYTVYKKEGGPRVLPPTTTFADLYGWAPPPTTTYTTQTFTTQTFTTVATTQYLPPTTPTTIPTTQAYVQQDFTTQLGTTVTTRTRTTVTYTLPPMVTTTETTTPPPPLLVSVTVQISIPFPVSLLSGGIQTERRLRSESKNQALERLQRELQLPGAQDAVARAIASALDIMVNEVDVRNPSAQMSSDMASLLLSMDAHVTLPSGAQFSPWKAQVQSLGHAESDRAQKFLQQLGPELKSAASYEPARLPDVKILAQALLGAGAKVVSAETRVLPPAGSGILQIGPLKIDYGPVQEWVQEERKTLLKVGLAVMLLPLAYWLCCSVVPRGYQRIAGSPQTRSFARSVYLSIESRSSRSSRVKIRVEKYASRALDLLMAAEPDYQDSELIYLVKVLNRCRGHAKALCGSPWGQWQTSGDCQMCRRRVDRAEKGLQCAQGGHRLCWPCMVKILDWDSLGAEEGMNQWTWVSKDWL